eukprot:1161959-Pelagomonas_calceolata.AAC.7
MSLGCGDTQQHELTNRLTHSVCFSACSFVMLSDYEAMQQAIEKVSSCPWNCSWIHSRCSSWSAANGC